MAEIEIFTPTGVLAGTTAGTPLTASGPDLTAALPVRDAQWFPLDGGPAHQGIEAEVAPDDILVIVTPPESIYVHMTWFSVTLDIGPYRVSGELATHPGFDPSRALARPGGIFVPLRDVHLELLDAAGAGTADRPHVHVNRYAVERVVSSLMLGHYFPGAVLATPETAALA
jgi:hypothetical protein